MQFNLYDLSMILHFLANYCPCSLHKYLKLEFCLRRWWCINISIWFAADAADLVLYVIDVNEVSNVLFGRVQAVVVQPRSNPIIDLLWQHVRHGSLSKYLYHVCSKGALRPLLMNTNEFYCYPAGQRIECRFLTHPQRPPFTNWKLLPFPHTVSGKSTYLWNILSAKDR